MARNINKQQYSVDDDTHFEKRNIIRQIGIEMVAQDTMQILFHIVFFFFFRDFIWLFFSSLIFVSRVPCGATQSSVGVCCKKIDRWIRHEYQQKQNVCFESSSQMKLNQFDQRLNEFKFDFRVYLITEVLLYSIKNVFTIFSQNSRSVRLQGCRTGVYYTYT